MELFYIALPIAFAAANLLLSQKSASASPQHSANRDKAPARGEQTQTGVLLKMC